MFPKPIWINKHLFNKRGFTLLEVLVVVAIVGVLAAAIIFSLSDSKGKGADAAIKSAMMQALDQAELFYNSHGRSYEGVCVDDPFDKDTIGRFLIAAQNTYGGTVNAPYFDNVASSFDPELEVCHDSPDAYVAWVPLRFLENWAWCIDSNNTSKITQQTLPANQLFCPF